MHWAASGGSLHEPWHKHATTAHTCGTTGSPRMPKHHPRKDTRMKAHHKKGVGSHRVGEDTEAAVRGYVLQGGPNRGDAGSCRATGQPTACTCTCSGKSLCLFQRLAPRHLTTRAQLCHPDNLGMRCRQRPCTPAWGAAPLTECWGRPRAHLRTQLWPVCARG